MEPILQIENLTHTYSAGTPFQRSAVEGLSLTVEDCADTICRVFSAAEGK